MLYNSDYRRRCRMFPSLVNCCTIDWFEKWPEEALLSVAERSLKKIGNPELVRNLASICVTIHKVRLLKLHQFCRGI